MEAVRQEGGLTPELPCFQQSRALLPSLSALLALGSCSHHLDIRVSPDALMGQPEPRPRDGSCQCRQGLRLQGNSHCPQPPQGSPGPSMPGYAPWPQGLTAHGRAHPPPQHRGRAPGTHPHNGWFPYSIYCPPHQRTAVLRGGARRGMFPGHAVLAHHMAKRMRKATMRQKSPMASESAKPRMA